VPHDAAVFQNATDEKHVVSAALAHPGNRDRFVELLRPEDFTVAECRVIAWGLIKAHGAGVAPDPRSFHTLVEDCPESLGRSFGGAGLLAQLIASCPTPLADFDSLATRVRLIGTKDRLYSACIAASAVASDPKTGLMESRLALLEAQGVLDGLSGRDTQGFRTVDQINRGYFETMRERKGGRAFRPCGLPPLDEMLYEGFLPGRLSVLASRPSNGKSTVVANLVHRMGAHKIGSVALFSVEADAVAVWDKLNAIATGIALRRLGKDAEQLTPEEDRLLFHAMRERTGHQIEVNDSKTFTVVEMEETIAHRYRTGKKFDVVFIDLFSRASEFDNDSLQGGSYTNAVATALKQVQQIAQRYQFHAVLVVQIGRLEGQKQQRKDVGRKFRMIRPTEDDIYGSDAYLQYADNIFLLHRCWHYDPIRYRDDLIEIWVRKQRYGEPSMRCFEFEKETGRVRPTDRFPVDFTEEERVQYAYRTAPPQFRGAVRP
jgi:replicative DNA helicase